MTKFTSRPPLVHHGVGERSQSQSRAAATGFFLRLFNHAQDGIGRRVTDAATPVAVGVADDRTRSRVGLRSREAIDTTGPMGKAILTVCSPSRLRNVTFSSSAPGQSSMLQKPRGVLAADLAWYLTRAEGSLRNVGSD